MLKINQIKLPVGHAPEELEQKIRKTLRLSRGEAFSYKIVRKSFDARKKPEIYEVYSVTVEIKDEDKILKKLHTPSISKAKEVRYQFPERGSEKMKARPVIVGAGPAGLFAALQLTEAGYAPIVLERGRSVEKRKEDVEHFWETGVLDPASNVQFGEGGAGTFSDGKLNTVVKDPSGRNQFVLETFVRYGAPDAILYENKPHIGTDVLACVIENMRKDLERKGAEFHFESCMSNLNIEGGRVVSVVTDEKTYKASAVILALGHSARDTFEMLAAKPEIPMEVKNFAVGFRVEHPQTMIDEIMYGNYRGSRLPASPYKVTSNFPNGRGVYSFCMCPGGYVVNASSEEGRTCVNGMSYSGRSGKNANSAIIVSVTPQDFGADDPLAGMRFQRHLEEENYKLGGGRIPQQLFGDYVQNVKSSDYGVFASQTKGQTVLTNLRGLMSEDMERSFIDGMTHFSTKIKNFDRADAILSGMETRTSSPVRILRNENCESALQGLYPCGEGAGYAGGIMSAAIDGLKVASAIMERFCPAEA